MVFTYLKYQCKKIIHELNELNKKPSWQLLIGSSAFLATIDFDSLWVLTNKIYIILKRRNVGFQADSKKAISIWNWKFKAQKPQFIAQRYLESNKVIVREILNCCNWLV